MVGQSNAGREVIEIGTDESGSAGVLNGELGGESGCQRSLLSIGSDERGRVEIEVGLIVVGLLDGGEEFVAQPQVQSESRSHFEIVESIDRVNLTVIDNVRGHTGDGSAIADALQERGEGLSAAAWIGWIVIDEKAASEVH